MSRASGCSDIRRPRIPQPEEIESHHQPSLPSTVLYWLSKITDTWLADLHARRSQARPGGGWTVQDGNRNMMPQAIGACTVRPMKINVEQCLMSGGTWFSATAASYLSADSRTASRQPPRALPRSGRDSTPPVMWCRETGCEESTATATNGGRWFAYPSHRRQCEQRHLARLRVFSSMGICLGRPMPITITPTRPRPYVQVALSKTWPGRLRRGPRRRQQSMG